LRSGKLVHSDVHRGCLGFPLHHWRGKASSIDTTELNVEMEDGRHCVAYRPGGMVRERYSQMVENFVS